MDDLRAQAQRWTQEGDYRAAAQAWEQLGDLPQARELYTKLFDSAAAARVARKQGDLLGALELSLKGHQLEEAEAIRRALMAGLSGELPKALALFEARGFDLQAAELAESLGRLGQAARSYAKAGQPGRAGALLERLGRWREAGEAYEALLRGAPDDLDGCLGLGRVLQRFGRHREAVAWLGRALALAERGGEGREGARAEAGRRLALAFDKVGLGEAARVSLGRAGVEHVGELAPVMRALEDELALGAPDADGETLEGRYRVERALGGHLSATYLGRDLLRDRPVVLRFFAGVGSQDEQDAFYGELERLKEAACPGHAKVLEVHRGLGLVASEYVEGQTLRRALSSQPPLKVGQCRGVILQVLEAVSAAHRVGALHGALTTTCIRLMPGGACVVEDWGVRHIERKAATQTGGPESSFVYRAPELNLGGVGGVGADLYSVAAVLFRCLRGEAPRLGQGGQGWEGWPEGFGAFFGRALALDAAERFGSHEAIKRALLGLPWEAVAARVVPASEPAPLPTAAASGAGPRFSCEGRLTVGACLDGQDRWLGRAVRLLGLPPRERRGGRFLERLGVWGAAGGAVFQDILGLEEEAWDEAAGFLVLEPLPPLGPAELREPWGWFEAALGLGRALAHAHDARVGLGTLGAQTTPWSAGGFRVSLEGTALAQDEGEAARIAADLAGFWEVVAHSLGVSEASAAGVLGGLVERGWVPRGEAQAALGRAPRGAKTVGAWVPWLEELRRVGEGLEERRARLGAMKRGLEARGAPQGVAWERWWDERLARLLEGSGEV